MGVCYFDMTSDELAGSSSEDYSSEEEQREQEEEEQAKVKKIGNGKAKSKSKKKAQQQQQEKEKELKPCIVFKYSKDIPLAEEITIGGKNMFLQIIEGIPAVLESISLERCGKNIVLKPHDQAAGSPIFPYSFANREEIVKFIKLAQAETIDSLFLKHKSIWNKIVYADKKLIGVLAIDSLYSYFQDKFSTTHYDVFIGNPDSGKGAILLGFKYLGYRVVVASDMSGANLLDLLGSMESNQVTIAEDELQNIHDDPDKLRITKVGYDNVGAVPRTLEGNTSNRFERWYNPFCFKIYASEESPDQKKLEGFNDRTFKHHTIAGKPTVYAKKLSQATNSNDYNEVKARIDYLRKLTFMFRLIHHSDTIEEIDTNIQNRALELTEPQLRLFNSDKLASADKKVLNDEVIPILSYCLRERGELTKGTLEAVIHRALDALLPTAQKEIILQTKHDEVSAVKMLSREDVYTKVKELAEGTANIGDDGKEHSFYSAEYGKVSDKRIFNICRDKFHVKEGIIVNDSGRKRAMRLDENIVNSIGKSLNAETEIIIKSKSADSQTDSSLFDNDDDSGLWNDYLGIEQSTSQSEQQNRKNASFSGNKDDSEIGQNQARINHDNNENNPLSPENNIISCSPVQNDDKKEQEQSSSVQQPHNLYWSGSQWSCHSCKLRGDKFTMQNIPCKGVK